MKLVILVMLMLLNISLSANEQVQPPFRGEGTFSWMFLKIYKARLWSYPEADIYSKPVKLELEYLKNFTGKEIVKQSLKELSRVNLKEDEMKEFEMKLTEIFPDVKVGDVILADYTPERGIAFYLNSSKSLGVLQDQNLSKKFLNIWLGDNTSAPQLRKLLLGK